MTVALDLAKAGKGDTVSKLVVVDMAPTKLIIDAKMRSYVTVMQGMNSMPAGMIKSLVDAERFLMAFEEVSTLSRRAHTYTLISSAGSRRPPIPPHKPGPPYPFTSCGPSSRQSQVRITPGHPQASYRRPRRVSLRPYLGSRASYVARAYPGHCWEA